MATMARLERPFLRRELHGAALGLTRLVAITYVTLALIATVRWIPRWIDFRLGQARETAVGLADGGPYLELSWAATIAAGAAWVVLGALIEWRRSSDLLGNLLFVGFVASGLIDIDLDVIVPMQRGDSLAQFQVPVIFLTNAISVPWIYAFPDGRVIPRWAVVPGAIFIAWQLLRIVTPAFDQANLGRPAVLLSLALVIGPFVALVYRYFWRSDYFQRQQLKWVLFGALVFVLAYIATLPIPLLIPELQNAGPSFAYRTVSRIWLSLSLVVVAFALAIAVLRQHLLDVDLVIRRSVVYAIVGVILAAIFALVSTVVQAALVNIGGQHSDLATAVIALIVALGFGPVRRRVEPIADRFLPARELLTVCFVDIAGSTERLAEVGDERWRGLLAAYRSAVRQELRAFRGREVDTAGDGFFATFEVPARAVLCAIAIRAAIGRIGLRSRIGLHAGECEMRGEKVSGITVHIGARLMSLAAPDEIIVSRFLRDLTQSVDVQFEGRGEHGLKGVRGTWEVFSVGAAPPPFRAPAPIASLAERPT